MAEVAIIASYICLYIHALLKSIMIVLPNTSSYYSEYDLYQLTSPAAPYSDGACG